MIRKSLRGLLAWIRAAPGSGRPGSRLELAGDPVAQNHPPSALRSREADLVTAEKTCARTLNDPGDVDRLVRLTFDALLRREPDQDTLSAYREGFANGSTFQDLIADVLGSEDYTLAQQRMARRQVLPNHSGASRSPGGSEDLERLVAVLATRLAEKGCQVAFGGAAEPNRSGLTGNERRLLGLRVTLSVLDRL